MPSSLLPCLGVLWTLGLLFAPRAVATPAADVFEAYLHPSTPPADGFEPMPDPARSLEGGPVRALAHGRVVAVDARARSLTLEHLFYENHELLRVRAEYGPLDKPAPRVGAAVQRGQLLGRVAAKGRLVVGLHGRQRLSPDEARTFLQQRARLPLPAREPVLLLVSHAEQAMRLYTRGREVTRVEVGFGQAEGRKLVSGDNRTPMGMYHVVQKHRGTFTGPYAEYYGGHWMRLNYPNPWDADRGLAEGLITREVRDRIARAWAERKPTEGSTPLGGGIGFHGWVGPWTREETGGRLSWGCVVMHTPDITALYEKIPPGTLVVLF